MGKPLFRILSNLKLIFILVDIFLNSFIPGMQREWFIIIPVALLQMLCVLGVVAVDYLLIARTSQFKAQLFHKVLIRFALITFLVLPHFLLIVVDMALRTVCIIPYFFFSRHNFNQLASFPKIGVSFMTMTTTASLWSQWWWWIFFFVKQIFAALYYYSSFVWIQNFSDATLYTFKTS